MPFIRVYVGCWDGNPGMLNNTAAAISSLEELFGLLSKVDTTGSWESQSDRVQKGTCTNKNSYKHVTCIYIYRYLNTCFYHPNISKCRREPLTSWHVLLIAVVAQTCSNHWKRRTTTFQRYWAELSIKRWGEKHRWTILAVFSLTRVYLGDPGGAFQPV
jgi:hypothetical protein